jgi:predicted ester cyclase
MTSMLDENKALVRRFSNEFKNKANHRIVDELMTANFQHHFKDPRLPKGREGMKLLGGSVVHSFPDVQANIQELIAEGDRVVERTEAHGTHQGEFNGVPPTGKPVAWTELHVYRIERGKIAELWSEIDFLGILMQIGAIPAQ